MSQKINNVQVALYLVSIAVFGVLILLYGWQFYATITEQPGARGYFHDFFDLSKKQFAAYNGSVVGVSFLFMVLSTVRLFQQKSKQLNRTFIWSVVFILLVVLSEYYLDSRFTPKG